MNLVQQYASFIQLIGDGTGAADSLLHVYQAWLSWSLRGSSLADLLPRQSPSSLYALLNLPMRS